MKTAPYAAPAVCRGNRAYVRRHCTYAAWAVHGPCMGSAWAVAHGQCKMCSAWAVHVQCLQEEQRALDAAGLVSVHAAGHLARRGGVGVDLSLGGSGGRGGGGAAKLRLRLRLTLRLWLLR